MPRWTPCKRRDLIQKLRKLGSEGPYPGGDHEYLRRGAARIPIPSYLELSVPLLRRLLLEVENVIGREITLEEWTGL